MNLFRANTLHLHEKEKLEEETSQVLKNFFNRLDGFGPSQVEGVHMNNIPSFEDLFLLTIVLYDIDKLNGNLIGELARLSLQKYENSVRLLRYNNQIRLRNSIKAVFQSSCCPKCGTFCTRVPKVERPLNKSNGRVKNVHPRNVCQIREKPLEKLDSSGIKYASDLKTLQKNSN